MRPSAHTELIGSSRAIRELQAEVAQIARSDAKVLITGESGTGKEIVARTIGTTNGRAGLPFVQVNCAGIPEPLLEAELFGHAKGGFAGAYRDTPGKLEMATNGTIFLDEIGEMSLRVQGLLLRFLETDEVQRLGAERVATAPNVRVVAVTNCNLSDLVTRRQFREDLFYRINVIHLVVPPLRERREDIPLLIDHFMKNFTRAELGATGHGYVGGVPYGAGRPIVREIASDAVAALCAYSWPGNVRQLENVIEQLVVTGRNHRVYAADLPPEVRAPADPTTPGRDRRKAVAEDLLKKLVANRESFWTTVYPMYMNREITRSQVRQLVHRGLEEARGNYRIVLRLFNMEPNEYKRFLNFLRKHDCQLPFKRYRHAGAELPEGHGD